MNSLLQRMPRGQSLGSISDYTDMNRSDFPQRQCNLGGLQRPYKQTGLIDTGLSRDRTPP